MKLCLVLCAAAGLWSCGGDVAHEVESAQASWTPPNVLLVVVDTLRMDHLTPYGYSVHSTTPNLENWVQQDGAEVYQGMLASSSWTKPGVATLFTGQDPHEHGVMRLVGPGSKLKETHTLAAEFSQGGYATACVMSNFLLSKRMGGGFEKGFDVYDDHIALKPNPHRGSTAASVTDSGLAWLHAQSAEKPWFLVLHYFDPHASFEDHEDVDWVDPNYQGWVVGGASTDLLRQKEEHLTVADHAALTAFYDEEVHAVDAQIGRLFHALKAQEMWSQTVVAFTADHGEELGERGHIGHTQTLCAELVDLPFLLRVPDTYQSHWFLPESPSGGYAMRQIYSALLGVAQLPLPPGRTEKAPPFLTSQVDFVPVRQDHLEKYVQKRALRNHGLHYILDTQSGVETLYDIEADPRMEHPLPSSHPGWEKMRVLLGKHLWWEAP